MCLFQAQRVPTFCLPWHLVPQQECESHGNNFLGLHVKILVVLLPHDDTVSSIPVLKSHVQVEHVAAVRLIGILQPQLKLRKDTPSQIHPSIRVYS